MTRQQKIKRLEKSGKRVVIVYSYATNGKIIINGKKEFDSVNQAHKYYYGY